MFGNAKSVLIDGKEVTSIVTSDGGTLYQKYYYYNDTQYVGDVVLNISLPPVWKLEFILSPTDRSTSGGGNSHYIKLEDSEGNQYWVGQGTSAGSHGIMVRPSTNLWCNSNTTIGVNNVTVTYDGSTLTYTCNGESVNASVSNITAIVGVTATYKGRLRGIKVTKL